MTESTAALQWLAASQSEGEGGDALLDRMLDEFITADTAACSATTATAAFKALADQCRDAETRTRLTQRSSKLAEASSAMLKCIILSDPSPKSAESVDLLEQVLRCIGNLSIDNNEARSQLLACTGGIEAIAAALSLTKETPSLARAAFGAALNTALDSAECTKALLAAGALLPHLKALDFVPSDVWPIVCTGLDNLCEHDDACALFEQHAEYAASVLRTLGELADRLKKGSEEEGEEDSEEDSKLLRGAMRTLVWVLCETVEKSDVVRAQLCLPSTVLSVFDLLEFYLSAKNEQQPADAETRAENPYADAVTQAIVGISGHEQALTVLFPSQPLMSRLVSILTEQKRSDGMAAAAALCLGNMARSDEHCTQLVSQHPETVRTLISDWLIPRSVNVRTRHAASGLLKNL
ncbi:hypothetical protein IWW38_003837, partial [Coemansia aciculifera]